MVEAAGCVVWRAGPEVLLVHRPRYDDWSFPKGKLDTGESFVDAAVREVEEETGCSGELGAELPSIRYADHKGRDKIVRYWLMAAAPTFDAEQFEPNDEVDRLGWFAPGEAASVLSYDRDVAVLRAASELLDHH